MPKKVETSSDDSDSDVQISNKRSVKKNTGEVSSKNINKILKKSEKKDYSSNSSSESDDNSTKVITKKKISNKTVKKDKGSSSESDEKPINSAKSDNDNSDENTDDISEDESKKKTTIKKTLKKRTIKDEDCLVNICFNHNSIVIKTFELLSDNIESYNLILHRKTEKIPTGIRIYAFSDDRNTYIRSSMDGSKFTHMHLDEENFFIGVEAKEFFNSIKLFTESYTMNMYVLKKTPEVICLYGENISKVGPAFLEVNINMLSISKDQSINNGINGEPDRIFSLKTSDYNYICKTLSPYTFINIKVNEDVTLFTGHDGKKSRKITLAYNIDEKQKSSEKNIEVIFDYKAMNNVSKINKLSKQVDLYFNDNGPIIIYSNIMSTNVQIGKIYIFISPIEKDAIV